jgi:hypothetical protein
MKISWIKLTPKKAQAFLDARASNRPLDEGYATKLGGAMSDGKWEPNGESIKFNDKRQMEDGQHRCLAVVISGVTIVTLLVEGLPSNNGIFETIDVGKKRTVGHMFARSGEKHYNQLAAAAAWLWRYKDGRVTTFDSPRHDQASEILQKHPTLRDSVSAVSGCHKVMSVGLAAFLHYLFKAKDKALANSFFEMLGSGEGLSKTSPKTSGIYQLRELLMEDRNKRSRRHAYVIAALCIKAWNAVRTGRVCKQTIKWTTDERFPAVE